MSALCWFNSLLIEFKMLVVKKKVTSPSIPPTYNFTSLHFFWFVKQTKKEDMSSSAEIGKHHFRYMSHCSGFDSSIVLYFGVKTNNCVVLYFWNNNTMWGSPERIMRSWDLWKWKSNKLPFACCSIRSKKSD